MGQSLAIPRVEHVRDSILLALHGTVAAGKESIQSRVLQICQRHDQEETGIIARDTMVQVVHDDLALGKHWSRQQVDAFLELFATAMDDEHIDYERLLDFVFYPVCAPSRAVTQRLELIKTNLTTTSIFTIHSGRWGRHEVTVKELLLGISDREGAGQTQQQQPMARSTVSLTPSDVATMRSHINALRTVTHPQLVRYHTTLQHQHSIFLVEEPHHPSCTLQTILTSFGPMKEPTIRRYLLQILHALAFLHDRDLNHGFLTLDTVNIDSCGVLQLSEFGLGPHLRKARPPSQSLGSDGCDWTERYPPPEVADPPHYWTSRSDVWCVGILVLQMAQGMIRTAPPRITGKAPSPPSRRASAPQQYHTHKADEAMIPEIPATMSKNLRALVRACLHRQPRKRATVQQLLHMGFFQIDPITATNEILRDVCTDLDASMKRLTFNTGVYPPLKTHHTTSAASTSASRPTRTKK
ncbi:hypothetical protein Poli38472_012094 [Pythium oligandrum]|uniref:Protein kinase domain-containing protein n=1 Tax=Pythium oligandrum TaxID=41045 RepID=A0A8K1CQ77_PYTOL|nr:hypothetical protein Poli38472_012094 [Pythium oligandrum]|eukprot:TMW66978.1 hypothetical protein Poli38472_012094 [Pythium oligandrum]